MLDKFWLFIVVGRAAIVTTFVVFGLGALAFKVAVTRWEEEILGLTVLLLPAGAAAWWIFRKLQEHCTRREARAVAIAFVVFAPVSMGIAILLSQTSGGFAAMFLGSSFGLVGAFAGAAVITALVSFVLCLLTLRFTRHIIKSESMY
jgi:ABC-type molybdate transport system permease subunit